MPNDPISKIKLPNNTTYDIHDSRIDSITSLENAESASYSDVKTKITNGTLVPGTWYRITDYVATTTDSESRSANHPFDIIVMASANNKLSEEGYAALHSGDSYFANNNLAAWKVWYCIDNDTTRFAWADSTNGKGVVYRLIDEFQNDLPFDFKGIQFKRYKIDDIDIKYTQTLRALVVEEKVAIYLDTYVGLSVTANKFITDSSDYKWFYAFTHLGSTWSAEIADASVGSASLSTHNTVKPTTSGKLQNLTNVVFARGEVLAACGIIDTYEDAAAIHNCSFGEGSTQLSIFGHAANNRSGGQFRRNIILGHFRHNTIASDVQNNEFCAPEDFSFNDFGDLFDSNSIVGSAIDGGSGTVFSNRFESQFRDNIILASDFSYNVFNSIFRRNNAQHNVFNFQGNEFGVVYDTVFYENIRFNVTNGYIKNCYLKDVTNCQFFGNLQYIDCEPNSSENNPFFTGVMVKGPIAGTSSAYVYLRHTIFSLGASNTTNRAVVVESNSDGEIIASWRNADGNATGIYATIAETESNTWHTISSGGGGGSGTVTSVGMTVPTGLSVSGSPITSSGTLAVSLASGYEIPQSSAVVHTTGNETIAGTKTFSTDTHWADEAIIHLGADGGIQNDDDTGFSWISDANGDSLQSALNAKQATLVSGTNIKTINSTSLLGSGDISIPAEAKVYAFDYTSWDYDIVDGHLTIPLATYEAMVADAQDGIAVILRLKCLTTSSGVVQYGVVSDFYLVHHYQSTPTWNELFFERINDVNIETLRLGKSGNSVSLTYGTYTTENAAHRTNSISGSGSTTDYPTTKAVVDYVSPKILPSVTSADQGEFLWVDYDSTSRTYKWKKDSPIRISSGLLDFDAGYGVNLRSSSGYSLTLTMGDIVRNFEVSSLARNVGWDWISYIYYDSSLGTSRTVSLQDALDSVLPPVTSSDNNKILKVVNGAWAAATGGGGSTADCVHITGDETVGGDKTFTDDIVVGDASNIKYGASSGQGFTMDNASTACINTGYVSFSSLSGEPKAFIMTFGDVNAATANNEYIIAVIGDSTGTHAVYTTGTQNNYSSGFTTSYSNGNFTITAPTGISFPGGGMTHHLVYYYGNGNLTFHTAQVSPGSGATSVTFTGTGLTAVPEMYATMLETQVNNESYRRVSLYTNCSARLGDVQALGVSFYSSNIYDTTSNFTVSYNNGLFINSGGTNAGGYFHNPGTYTLYYLMASDVGGGGGSYSDLADELSAMNTAISGKQATLVSGTNIKTINNTTLLGSGNISIPTLPTVTTTNNGQILEVSNGAWAAGRKITVSTSEPTAATGSNGDIWIVI